MIALEISSRNARVAALQKRWDRLRAGLDLILDQRGAEMTDLPGDASGFLCRTTRERKRISSSRAFTRRRTAVELAPIASGCRSHWCSSRSG
jgi:hypothetical protein